MRQIGTSGRIARGGLKTGLDDVRVHEPSHSDEVRLVFQRIGRGRRTQTRT
jgi:hypothetical protein